VNEGLHWIRLDNWVARDPATGLFLYNSANGYDELTDSFTEALWWDTPRRWYGSASGRLYEFVQVRTVVVEWLDRLLAVVL
jgi:hypothetical protein